MSKNIKNRIILDAAYLFCQRGYNNVSIKDIEEETKRNVTAHFSSKREILYALYDYYRSIDKGRQPDYDALLNEVEALHPHEVIKKMRYDNRLDVQNDLDRIIRIALFEYNSDPISAKFIYECLITPGINFIAPLLTRMIELKKVEPFDVDTFICVMNNFSFSAAIRHYSAYPVTLKEWESGLDMLFSFIKPIEK